MKNLVKLIALILLCGFLITLFGCGKKNDPDEENNEDGPSWDMEDFDFLIVFESDSEDGCFGYGVKDVLYDEMLNRMKETEEKYNCTIQVGYTPVSSDGAAVMSKIMSGQRIAEVLQMGYNNHPAKFCRAGMLIPLTDLSDYIDYENERKFGSVAQLECAMSDSVPYAVLPNALPYNMGGGSFLIIYNRDYVKEYNLPSPHEYYETKNWTFASLEKLVDTWYLGEDSHPQYVLSGPMRGFVELALLNNGIRFVKEENGELVTDIHTSAAVNAIDWLKNLVTNYSKTSLNIPEDYWDTSCFLSGNTFMALAAGNYIVKGPYQYNCDYEIGLMPFPNGPDAIYGQFSTYLEAGATYMFPISAYWPEASATILSDLFEPLKGYGDGEDMSSYYQANVFLDETDTEIYMHHLDYARYTYWNFDGLKMSIDIAASIYSSTPAQLIERNALSFEKTIDSEIKGNYEYLKTHMYNR